MSKLIFLDSLKDLDYEKLGMKCGLEIHQQLNTGKLFCSCPCEIVPNDTLDKQIERKLRFSLSETGTVDVAALHEFKKKKSFRYRYNNDIACLVDLDEEPPKGPNKKALDTAIKVSQMLDLTFFDKVSFMRKLIINGSVTSGFQRTAMLGFGGSLKTPLGEVSIENVNLEEDACRILENQDGHTVFSLDRLGIPLIEIATGPQIKSPDHAYEVAFEIGNILRSFKETKRGLGTIRQDLNVSIAKGARIEIKGAQNLKLLKDVAIAEVKRQAIHVSIIEELNDRGITTENFSDMKIYDLTKTFEKTTSKVVLSNLEKKGSGVFAIKLNKFKGILGHEMQENHRFATEVSDKNKHHFPQIKGLFHSDELPKYGITEEEVEAVRKELNLDNDDSFILIASQKDIAQSSLKYVLEIIQTLIEKVPTEVRQVDPKGTLTKFLRPMPGSARMYPETDIPLLDLKEDYLEEMKNELPEKYHQKLERLSKDLSIEQSKVESVLEKYEEDQIKNLITVSGKNAAYIYSVLFEIPKDIKKRENIEPIDFRYELLESILKEAKESNLNQNIIRDIFISLYQDNLSEVENLKKYIEEKNLIAEPVDESEIEDTVKKIIDENKGAPFGALMGHAMKAFGGKVDGKKISEILKKFM